MVYEHYFGRLKFIGTMKHHKLNNAKIFPISNYRFVLISELPAFQKIVLVTATAIRQVQLQCMTPSGFTILSHSNS